MNKKNGEDFYSPPIFRMSVSACSILLPWHGMKRNSGHEIRYVFSSVVGGNTSRILSHEYNRDPRKKRGEGAYRFVRLKSIVNYMFLHNDYGKRNALLFDYSSLEFHRTPLALVLGWTRIIPVAIGLRDLAITVMNDKLSSLVSAYIPTLVDCVPLVVKMP